MTSGAAPRFPLHAGPLLQARPPTSPRSEFLCLVCVGEASSSSLRPVSGPPSRTSVMFQSAGRTTTGHRELLLRLSSSPRHVLQPTAAPPVSVFTSLYSECLWCLLAHRSICLSCFHRCPIRCLAMSKSIAPVFDLPSQDLGVRDAATPTPRSPLRARLTMSALRRTSSCVP